MPNWRRRYDRHSQRLFLSERLSRADQLREVAMEACLIRMRDAVAQDIEALKLSSDEARRLARFELGRYAAHALMMPYAAFHQAASPRAIRHCRARLPLRRVLRAGREPARHLAEDRQRWRALLPDGGRHIRKPAAPRRGVRFPALQPLAAPARNCRSTTPSPGPAKFSPRRSRCLMGLSSSASPAQSTDRRAPSSNVRAAPRFFSVANIGFRDKLDLWSGAVRRGDPGRSGLPALRARWLPRSRRAAGHAPAWSRRNGDGPQRLRFSVAASWADTADLIRPAAPMPRRNRTLRPSCSLTRRSRSTAR